MPKKSGTNESLRSEAERKTASSILRNNFNKLKSNLTSVSGVRKVLGGSEKVLSNVKDGSKKVVNRVKEASIEIPMSIKDGAQKIANNLKEGAEAGSSRVATLKRNLKSIFPGHSGSYDPSNKSKSDSSEPESTNISKVAKSNNELDYESGRDELSVLGNVYASYNPDKDEMLDKKDVVKASDIKISDNVLGGLSEVKSIDQNDSSISSDAIDASNKGSEISR